jgi:hypothetical protein
VRLQRLRGPPPGVPALDLRPPDASVTGRIDALIQSGQLQPAHITDRVWELLHVLDARTVLAALDEWPPSNGTLTAQDGAVMLAALCQLQARTALLDLVALPGLTQAQAPQQVHHAATEPHLESGAAGYWAAPQVTGWGCDPPGLHYVSAAIHGRWLMCNAALRDRWAARRMCLGCGARMLQPHRATCALPGVAPSQLQQQQYAPPPPSMPVPRPLPAQAPPGMQGRMYSNGDLAQQQQQQQQGQRQAPPPGARVPMPVPVPANGAAPSWGAAPQAARAPPGFAGQAPPPLSSQQPAGVQWMASGSEAGTTAQYWSGQQQHQASSHGPPLTRVGSGGSMAPTPAAHAVQPRPGPVPLSRVPSGPTMASPPAPRSGWSRPLVVSSPSGTPGGASSSAGNLAASSSFATSGGGEDEGDDEDVCPICCETVDDTDKAFFPCACGFQPCMFCYNRILEIGDARCPACRRTYGAQNGGDDSQSSSSSSDSDSDSDSGEGVTNTATTGASLSTRAGRQAARVAARGSCTSHAYASHRGRGIMLRPQHVCHHTHTQMSNTTTPREYS